jgi:hypothetical protein
MKIKNRLTVFCLIYFSMFSAIAIADDKLECLQKLSITDKPVFSGLALVKFDKAVARSSEGGDSQVFVDSHGQPIYILVSEYGETGKRVALYKLLHGSTNSFAA